MILNRGKKRITTMILVLATVMALCIFANADNTFTQTVKVTQEIKNNPKRSTYTYVLTPYDEANPMPEGTKEGKYSFTIGGTTTDSSAPTFTFTFDATKAGNYLYYLRRVEAVPEGDTVSPKEHVFGYLVEERDGELVIIPYTCYDNKMEIWKETDANGNPIGITLSNSISGTETVSPSPSTSVTPSPSPSSSNGKGQYTPKTGDDMPLVLLIILAIVSVFMVIFLIWSNRRRQDDEEEKPL